MTDTCKTCRHCKPLQVLEGLPHTPGTCTLLPEWVPIKDIEQHYCGNWVTDKNE